MNRMEHSPPERESSSYWRCRGTAWLSKGGQPEGEIARVDNYERIYTTDNRRMGGIMYGFVEGRMTGIQRDIVGGMDRLYLGR